MAEHSMMDRRPSNAAETMRERILDARNPLGTKAGNHVEPTVMGRRLELLECVDPEVVMQTLGEHAPNAWHRRQDPRGIGLASQAIQHRQTPVGDELPDCARNARPHPRQLFEAALSPERDVRDPCAPVVGHIDRPCVTVAKRRTCRDLQDDRVAALVNGRRRELTIVGIVLSPEYVYAISPGELFPDVRRFSVFWMNRQGLASAFDMEGESRED